MCVCVFYFPCNYYKMSIARLHFQFYRSEQVRGLVDYWYTYTVQEPFRGGLQKCNCIGLSYPRNRQTLAEAARVNLNVVLLFPGTLTTLAFPVAVGFYEELLILSKFYICHHFFFSSGF